MKFLWLLILCLCVSSVVFAEKAYIYQEDWDKAPNSHRADWMAEGNYGLMTHYLISPQGNTPEEKTADFNRIIDNFSIEAYMDAFDRSGADWLIFTIGQNTGYWNSSNSVVDNVLPGRTSNRDLVLEIAKEVKKRGKKFIAYLPGEAAAVCGNDPALVPVFHWTQTIGTPEFYSTWADFLREYSLKLGKNCDGWWIDGIYASVHNMNYDWSVWADAMRAGNPDSAIGFSDSSYVMGYMRNVTPENDYFPGEVHAMEDGFIRTDPLFGETYLDDNGKIRQKFALPKFFVPKGPFLDGARLHALVPFDSSFNPTVKIEWASYDADSLIKLVHSFHEVGGGVTLNAPVNQDGSIPASTVEKLEKVGKSFKDKKKKYPLDMKVLDRAKKIKKKNPNPKNLAFVKPAKLFNKDMTEESGSSGGCHDAFLANDGEIESYAVAGDGNWAWTYWLDLEKAVKISEIKIFMGKNYATEFIVSTSTNGVNWTEAEHIYNADKKTEFSVKFNKKNVRYISVQSVKPDGAGQEGGQMAIYEIEVYK
ncbi:MAG: discoidin domain-containing protein [Armatimonadetes bacterium]|nr:discoidin domain-containing protein [Candidatus Hippobium faecium]